MRKKYLLLKVTFVSRHRRIGGSIEGIFDAVKNCLRDKIITGDYYYDPAISRAKNVSAVKKAAGEINHVTGDINFLALGLKGKKNVLTIHDFGHYEQLRKKNLIRFFILRYFWFQAPLRCVDIVTVVSQFTKRKLIHYFNFPEKNIRVICNPVKPIFKFKERLKNNKPVILQIGTGPHKNLNNLIEAVKGMDVHLDIVGNPDGACIRKLDSYGISYKLFTGLTDEEVYNRYIACDILFFASFHEGFGMPIIEAQSVGRPVITSNIDAMIEVAQESASLIDPHNPAEIKEAIITLTQDKDYYNDLIARGCKNALKFQDTKIADDYYKVYQELFDQIK